MPDQLEDMTREQLIALMRKTLEETLVLLQEIHDGDCDSVEGNCGECQGCLITKAVEKYSRKE